MVHGERIILLIIVTLLRFPTNSQTAGKQTQGTHDFIVNASVEELAHGYLGWFSHQSNTSDDSKTHRIEMPSLDVYSPSGVSLYFGNDSTANATLIRKLPGSLPKQGTSVTRPSLTEFIDMFHELKPQKGQLLSEQRYTVFAVTYPNWGRCKEQNEAIAQLRERRQQIPNIQIIEVRLHK
jgi:hypothetical protein